jgi:hypothetical protein
VKNLYYASIIWNASILPSALPITKLPLYNYSFPVILFFL